MILYKTVGRRAGLNFFCPAELEPPLSASKKLREPTDEELLWCYSERVYYCVAFDYEVSPLLAPKLVRGYKKCNFQLADEYSAAALRRNYNLHYADDTTHNPYCVL